MAPTCAIEPDVMTDEAREKLLDQFAAENGIECKAFPVIMSSVLQNTRSRKELTTAVEHNGSELGRLHLRMDSIPQQTAEKLSSIDIVRKGTRISITNVPEHAFRGVILVVLLLVLLQMRGVSVEDIWSRAGRVLFGQKADTSLPVSHMAVYNNEG